MPPLEQMRNYGLPELEQKFQYDTPPAGIEGWDLKRIDAFVDEQWHKRRNGEWWLIKGNPYYITGPAWTFFNYWETDKGGRPDFRMEAVEFFWIWEHVCMSPLLFGLFIVKCRRLGDTEKALFCGWEMITRYRKSMMGIQSYTDDEAKKAFKRLVYSNKLMVFFFRPRNKGKDDPETELVFRYDSKLTREAMEDSGMKMEDDSVKEVGSSVDYQPTILRKYDGRRLRFMLLDEAGKIIPRVMSVTKQWAVLRQCLALYNETVVVGKAILPTTVEEMANGETVKECTQMWKNSDPFSVSATGRTTSGLIRVFRGYLLAAEVDEWGFHLVESARAARESQIAAYMRTGDLESLADYMRKVPATIEESLAVPATSCVLFPALLDNQMGKINNPAFIAKVKDPGVRGDLLWIDRKHGNVRFVPNPVGKWVVGQMPEVPNRMQISGGLQMPANTGRFTIGVDSYDHAGADGSDGAIAVFRPFDQTVEDHLEYRDMEDGQREIMNKWQMNSGKFVACYRGRPYDPETFYEEVLKASIFYGVPFLGESNKPGVLHYFERVGFKQYCSNKPAILKIGANTNASGLASTITSINTYLGLLKSHVYGYSENNFLLPLLQDWRNFTGDNRTECDLMVASGFALLAANAVEMVNERKARRGEWSAPAFQTYKQLN